MKVLNEMRLTIPSRSANEGFARASVAAFVASLDPTVDELTDIKTAVSEAVTNCVVHAYANTIGKVYIVVSTFEGGVVRIKVRDRGCGIPDIPLARTPLYSSAGEERAGLGFAVMESFMDKVSVRSKVGVGTVVTLTKTLHQRQSC